MGRRICHTSRVAPASLLDDDDMLQEILIRLPPQPSSLLRVSAVCKRWRGFVTDPWFLHQFYAHHQNPPLLGIFTREEGIMFNPVMDPPDRIPPRRFNLGHCNDSRGYDLFDCRHSRVLVEDWMHYEVVVCNPIIGKQHRVDVPTEFRGSLLGGAVLCDAADHGHIHGGCHLSPFKVVLVSTGRSDNRTLAYVYSWETSSWGNLISIEAPCMLFCGSSAPLIGNCLYWLSLDDGILEFDLDENSLNLIMEPPVADNIYIDYGNRQIIQTETGVVGFAILDYPHFHMWQRNVNDHRVSTWTPWKTIEIHSILGLPRRTEGLVGMMPIIRGYDEDTDVLCVNVDGSVYMVHLKSIQSRKLYETVRRDCHYLFKSFYAPGDGKRLCN